MCNIDDLYDREKVLFRGIHTTVYSACCKRTGDRVALKKLRVKEQGISPLEAQVHKELEHPHIVKLRKTCPHKDKLVLVLDYAAGGHLGQLLYAQRASGEDIGGGGGEASEADGGGGEASDDDDGDGGYAGAGASNLGIYPALARRVREEAKSKARVETVSARRPGGGDDDDDRWDAAAGDRRPEKRNPLSPAVVKALMKALLEALGHCHEKGVLHCDVKPDNLLIDGNGRLLLADFGTARYLPRGATAQGTDGAGHSPPQVGAVWYRPPEQLLGCRMYGTAIDIWSAGCVFAEMMSGRVWFQGTSDVEQLSLIFGVLGTPSEETWPGVTRLPYFISYDKMPPQDLATIFPNATPDALDLLARLTCLCPERRLSAREALSQAYFISDPQPTPPGQLSLAATTLPARGDSFAAASFQARFGPTHGLSAPVGRCLFGRYSGPGTVSDAVAKVASAAAGILRNP